MESETMAVCRQCGLKHSVRLFESINVMQTPELKSEVLDGRAFMWACPQCGTLNLLRYKTLYHDPEARLMLWLTLGDEALDAQIQAGSAHLEDLEGYTLRLVREPGDLLEKVKIFEAGLDDIAIEMCKYVTAREMGLGDVAMRFLKIDGADSEITLSYPSNGQMQMVEIGFNTYEDCSGILLRNPAIKEKATGFVRVDSQWLSSFLA